MPAASPPDPVLADLASFLHAHSAYSLLPPSTRLIVLDTRLPLRKALAALLQNRIAAAPLYDACAHQFAGMLTMTDLVRVWAHHTKEGESVGMDVDTFQIGMLKAKSRSFGLLDPARDGDVRPPSLSPELSLWDMAQYILGRRLRRVALIDRSGDEEVIVAVVTQYRLLRYIASRFSGVDALNGKIRELGIGTIGKDVAWIGLDGSVRDAVLLFTERRVTALPVLVPRSDDSGDPSRGIVVNVYEKADVLHLAAIAADTPLGLSAVLDTSISEALLRRAEDFEGVHTCRWDSTLMEMMASLRKRARVHRFVLVDDQGRLEGMVTLSDILRYLVQFDR